MGLVFSILTAPVTAPIKGVGWIAEQVLESARETWYDVDAIHVELEQLNRRLEQGDIDESEFLLREEELLDRLEDARAWHAQRGR